MAPQSVKKAPVTHKFTIDASVPAGDKIFDVYVLNNLCLGLVWLTMNSAAFEKFLNDRVKIDGRTGNLGETVKISRQGEGKIVVVAHTEFSGRYLKYLTKKFLKKHQLRDWLRVVATSKGTYTLKFYNVQMDGAEDDEDDE